MQFNNVGIELFLLQFFISSWPFKISIQVDWKLKEKKITDFSRKSWYMYHLESCTHVDSIDVAQASFNSCEK